MPIHTHILFSTYININNQFTNHYFQAIAASGYGSIAITDDDDSTSVLVWGLFEGHTLVDPTKIRIANVDNDNDDDTTIKSAAAGGYHGLLLSETGRVWSFGKNSDGQLGDGKKRS